MMFINNTFIDDKFMFFIKNYFIFYLFGIIFATPIVKKIKRNTVTKIIVAIIYIFLFILTVSSLVGDTYNPFLYFRF